MGQEQPGKVIKTDKLMNIEFTGGTESGNQKQTKQ